MCSNTTMINLITLISVSGSVAAFMSQVTKRCWSQEDCDTDNECCALRMFTEDAYCVPLRREGEICLAMGMDEKMFDGLYDMTCPCGPNLRCVEAFSRDQYKQEKPSDNPRCRRTSYAPPSPNAAFYYQPFYGGAPGSYASSGSDSYAMSNAYAGK